MIVRDGLEDVVVKARAMGFNVQEQLEVIELYNFAIAYHSRNVPRPKRYNDYLVWKSNKIEEVKRLCDYNINITVDSWHKETKQ